jgi:hypothetical protein
MKKRRHLKNGNILYYMAHQAESLLKTKCIAESFVLWLLMHEAHMSVCIIINPKHIRVRICNSQSHRNRSALIILIVVILYCL